MCILHFLLSGKWKTQENEIFEMQKWNISKGRWEKGGHSSSYVYAQSYVHYNVKNGSFFVISAECSKKLVPVGATYLNASERSYLGVVYSAFFFAGALNYIAQTVTRFLLLSGENLKKLPISDILKAINRWSKNDN